MAPEPLKHPTASTALMVPMASMAAKQLLAIMESKETNLCVSIDVTKKHEVLQIVEVVGPYACMIKVKFVSFCSFFLSIKCVLVRPMQT